MEKDIRLHSSIEYRPKFSALTRTLRRDWERSSNKLKFILSKCTVEPYLGALPPELRARVNSRHLSYVTHWFRMRLEDFLIDKIYEIRASVGGVSYDLDQIGELFGTSCQLQIGGVNVAGVRKWSGAFGIVGKMSFPEIGAQYALKIFDNKDNDADNHGAMYEIRTAFAAARAEPHDNARVYMGALIYEPYMLSKWEGDKSDGGGRTNRNEIFVTSLREMADRNYRGGRRVDFGETYRTKYGQVSYKVRKMCRQLQYAMEMNDTKTMENIVAAALNSRFPNAKSDLKDATEIILWRAYGESNAKVLKMADELYGKIH